MDLDVPQMTDPYRTHRVMEPPAPTNESNTVSEDTSKDYSNPYCGGPEMNNKVKKQRKTKKLRNQKIIKLRPCELITDDTDIVAKEPEEPIETSP